MDIRHAVGHHLPVSSSHFPAQIPGDGDAEGKPKNTFRRHLLNKCQEEFEKEREFTFRVCPPVSALFGFSRVFLTADASAASLSLFLRVHGFWAISTAG